MTNDSASSWFGKSRADARARLRLFCFPYAGGSALIFRGWQEVLPPSVEVVPVQLPGRGARLREAPFTDLNALVGALLPVLGSRLDKPFAFFGHSMGAAIAFEAARRLRLERGAEPQHLFVSARRAPHLPDAERPLHDLPEQEFIEELRRLNGTPPEVFEHPELMQMMLPLLRADFSISETYVFEQRPSLSCPVKAFGGLRDPHVEQAGLEAWREHTAGAFNLCMFDGDHFFINAATQQLLRLIAGALSQGAGLR